MILMAKITNSHWDCVHDGGSTQLSASDITEWLGMDAVICPDCGRVWLVAYNALTDDVRATCVLEG